MTERVFATVEEVFDYYMPNHNTPPEYGDEDYVDYLVEELLKGVLQ